MTFFWIITFNQRYHSREPVLRNPCNIVCIFLQNVSGRSPPKVVLLVKSIMSDGQHRGFQTTAYIDPVKFKTQVITVPLDQKSSWKTCFDASSSGSHKASVRNLYGPGPMEI